MITIDEGFISSITGYIGMIFDDFLPLILLVVGLFLGFWILENVIRVAIGDKGLGSKKVGTELDEETGEELNIMRSTRGRHKGEEWLESDED